MVFCALMLFVVPEFKLIFDDFELELPLVTRFMLAIYNFLQEKLQKLDELCEQGLSLDEAFKRLGLFEPIVLSMLAVAMKSSKLHEMSAKISEYYKLR